MTILGHLLLGFAFVVAAFGVLMGAWFIYDVIATLVRNRW